MARRCFVLFLLLVLASVGFSQSQKEKLQQSKQKLEKEINYTNKLLSETRRNQKNSLKEIQLLKSQIKQREKLISNINSELNLLNAEIKSNNDTIVVLKERLKVLREDYAKIVVHTYKNLNSTRETNPFLFVLAADNFQQAFNRIKYTPYLLDAHRRQFSKIANTQNSILKKLNELSTNKQEKETLLTKQGKEKERLNNEKTKKDKTVKNLSKKEKELQQKLANQQKQRKELQRKIDQIIAEEIRKAEERKRKQEAASKKAPNSGSNTTTKTTTKPAGSLTLTPEEANLAADFAGNRGKLPWPVEKGVITEPFGKKQHPDLPHVVTENNGINITTAAGSSVRAVFNGIVVSVINLGSTYGVILRHGNYFTVYSNLASVSVKANEKVKTKQTLGKMGASKTDVHFEIRRDKEILNPTTWIAK